MSDMDDFFVDKLYPYRTEFEEAHGAYIQACNRGDRDSAKIHLDRVYSIIFETGLNIAYYICEMQEDLDLGEISESGRIMAERTLACMRREYTKVNSRLKSMSHFQWARDMTNAPVD